MCPSAVTAEEEEEGEEGEEGGSRGEPSTPTRREMSAISLVPPGVGLSGTRVNALFTKASSPSVLCSRFRLVFMYKITMIKNTTKTGKTVAEISNWKKKIRIHFQKFWSVSLSSHLHIIWVRPQKTSVNRSTNDSTQNGHGNTEKLIRHCRNYKVK